MTARGYADGADDGGDAGALAAVEEDEDEGFVVYPLQRYGSQLGYLGRVLSSSGLTRSEIAEGWVASGVTRTSR